LGPPSDSRSSSSPSDSSRSDSGWMEERGDRCDPLPLAAMTGEEEEADAEGSGEGANDRRVLLKGLSESDATCPSEFDPEACVSMVLMRVRPDSKEEGRTTGEDPCSFWSS